MIENKCKQDTDWRERFDLDEDLVKAIKVLASIIETNHITDDMRNLASLHLQQLEQDKGLKYVRYLEEENKTLKATYLIQGKKLAVKEILEMIPKMKIISPNPSEIGSEFCTPRDYRYSGMNSAYDTLLAKVEDYLKSINN